MAYILNSLFVCPMASLHLFFSSKFLLKFVSYVFTVNCNTLDLLLISLIAALILVLFFFFDSFNHFQSFPQLFTTIYSIDSIYSSDIFIETPLIPLIKTISPLSLQSIRQLFARQFPQHSTEQQKQKWLRF